MARNLPAEIYCRHCGEVIDRDRSPCPHCGVENKYAGAASNTTSSSGETGSSSQFSLAPEHELQSKTQLWKGVKGGIYSWIIGLILTSLLFISNLMTIASNAMGVLKSMPGVAAAVGGGALLETPGSALVKLLAWVFYSSHFVPVSISASAVGESVGRSQNIVTVLGSQTGLNPFLFHIVPVGLLFWFGYSVSQSTGYTKSYENFAAGASVAIGYVIFAVIGVMFSGVSVGNESIAGASAGPPMMQSLLVFGGFAIAGGGLGGLTRYLRERPAEASSSGDESTTTTRAGDGTPRTGTDTGTTTTADDTRSVDDERGHEPPSSVGSATTTADDVTPEQSDTPDHASTETTDARSEPRDDGRTHTTGREPEQPRTGGSSDIDDGPDVDEAQSAASGTSNDSAAGGDADQRAESQQSPSSEPRLPTNPSDRATELVSRVQQRPRAHHADELIDLVTEPGGDTSRQAMMGLRYVVQEYPGVVAENIDLIGDRAADGSADERTRQEAAEVLRRLSESKPRAVEGIADSCLALLDADDPEIRSTGCNILENVGDETALEKLKQLKDDDSDFGVRTAANRAIHEIE